MRLPSAAGDMDILPDHKCVVVAQGVPHGTDVRCACTPCNAVRQHVDLGLDTREDAGSGVDVIRARCVPLVISAEGAVVGQDCTPQEAAAALGVPLRPVPSRARVSPSGQVYTLEYQGLWCIKIADLERCSATHVHMRFRRVCQVEITRAREADEREVSSTFFGAVRHPLEHAFLEQWSTCEEAEGVLRSFAGCEEVWLKAGDTAWAQEGSGRTILSDALQGQAEWHVGSSRFAVQIDRDDAAAIPGRSWTTQDLALWVQALETCSQLPDRIFSISIWIHVPADGVEDADLYVRRLPDCPGESQHTPLSELARGCARSEVSVYRAARHRAKDEECA